MALSQFAGTIDALQFAYGSAGCAAPALFVVQGSTSTGAYTILCSPAKLSTSDGLPITINTTTSITIGSDSGVETVTPTAVSTNNLNQLLITATFTYAHGTGARVVSGTLGLSEAVLYASNAGGGNVVLSPQWTRAGGTTANYNTALLAAPSGVSFQDNRLAAGSVQTATVPITNAQLITLNSAPLQVIPAQGSGTLIDVQDAIFNNVFISAAMTSGGAIQLSYGSAVTYPATPTIAATFLTSASSSQAIKVAGVLALTSSVNCENKPIFLYNATGNFAGSGTANLVVNYKVLNGVA